jgi:curved DNA-binding protein CbpA
MDAKVLFKTPYDVLGLEYNATQEQIKAAYRELSFLHHPDKHENNASEAVKKHHEEQQKEINAAYSKLTDATKKAEIDAVIRASQQKGKVSPYRKYKTQMQMFDLYNAQATEKLDATAEFMMKNRGEDLSSVVNSVLDETAKLISKYEAFCAENKQYVDLANKAYGGNPTQKKFDILRTRAKSIETLAVSDSNHTLSNSLRNSYCLSMSCARNVSCDKV